MATPPSLGAIHECIYISDTDATGGTVCKTFIIPVPPMVVLTVLSVSFGTSGPASETVAPSGPVISDAHSIIPKMATTTVVVAGAASLFTHSSLTSCCTPHGDVGLAAVKAFNTTDTCFCEVPAVVRSSAFTTGTGSHFKAVI